MQRVFRFLGTVAALMMFFIVPAGAEPAQVLTEDEQYLASAYEVMAGVSSESFKFTAYTGLPGMQIEYTVDGRGDMQPAVALQGTMHVTMTNLLGMETRHDSPFYARQEGNDLICYVRSGNGTWEKSIMKKFSSMMQRSKTQSAKDYAAECVSGVKQVKVLQDTAENRTLQVTFDSKKIGGLVEKKMNAANLDTKEQNEQKKLQEVMDVMGDIDFTMTVDKKTKYITSIVGDLTEPCRRVAGAMLAESGNMKATQRGILQGLIDGSTLKIEVTQQDFNAIAPVVVPEEVIKGAVTVQIGTTDNKKAEPQANNA
jgi:hypothetical protein